MKNLIKLTTTLMMLLLCVGFVSCNDNGDEDSSDALIVGTWRRDFKFEDLVGELYHMYVFNSDGTGSYQEIDEDEDDYTYEKITYKYNEKTSRLTVTSQYGDIYEYNVLSLTKTELVLGDEGDMDYWYRVE